MNYKNKFFDPVNYEVQWNEMENFPKFLNELTDVPESQSLNNIDISKAGITNQQIIFHIRWFDGNIVPIYADVDLSVSLEWHRGIHMSRCEEVLFEASEKEFETLTDITVFIAKELQKQQNAIKSFVKISATYFMNHVTHKTKRNSKDKIILLSETSCEGENIFNFIGLKVFNITACPCTRTYTKFSTIPALYELGLDTKMINNVLNVVLTGTHMQRGVTTLKIEDNSQIITHKELFEILDNSVHLIFDLLKRPDEHDLVIRALKKPQFTEDVSRDVASELVNKYSHKIHQDAEIFIESILNDSIHIHDVKTSIYEKFSIIQKQYESK